MSGFLKNKIRIPEVILRVIRRDQNTKPLFVVAAMMTAVSACLLPGSTQAIGLASLAPGAALKLFDPLIVMHEAARVEMITAGNLSLPANVAMSLVRASAGTGVDLKLLIAVAHRESAFSPTAKARTSSATGLYQFIDSTWLGAVRDYGARHGLAREAAMISSTGEVASSEKRSCILGLRKNPDIAAAMAAEMLRGDAAFLSEDLERKLTDTDLYAAHFLGVHKAAKLAAMTTASPNAAAARVFPREARANRSIFYQKKGRKLKSRTVKGVYDRLTLPYADDASEIARQARRIFGDLDTPAVQLRTGKATG